MRPAIEVAENICPYSWGEFGDKNALVEASAIIEADRAELVAEIVAWLRGRAQPHRCTADQNIAELIEAKWGKV